MASDKEPEFHVTFVRSPGMTEEERRRRVLRAYEIILGHGRERRAQESASEQAKPKPAETISVTDDLVFEVGDDYLTLRHDQTAITIRPNEVQAILKGLIDAAARLASRQQEAQAEAVEATESEGKPVNDAKATRVDSFWSSAIEWLEQMRGLGDEELEILRQEAQANYTGEQWKAFVMAYSLYREFGPEGNGFSVFM